ncbi:cleavage stimulation factor subunit 2 [Phlebotomus argentipes]|uniref:cleavage stimulation factor subunit 2 n=1 Tax=Phlebotomus argentipes TaxID=94469 RepID=UPI002892A5AB|nr:cleavage stimulation factor subunit 2 [Phlebotomus argentipes]
MGDKNSDQSIMDKSMRSVFVGNIPYEATEEKLKEIFSEVGPVISLKLVFDRESGKPKGYGFCEYKDQETALSAMRNLNGYEIGGRTLRVDNACTEKSRMEMQQLLQGPQVENPYGEPCDPESAPELITKTVASLPPEQMYELMKQMKTCIQNNPSEARQMLLLNPQLAYALLQAQVVMRIVDPATAATMLFKPNQMPPVLTNQTVTQIQLQQQQQQQQQQQMTVPQPVPPVSMSRNDFSAPLGQDIDLRSVDPRLTRSLDQDMRSLGQPLPVPDAFGPTPRAARQVAPTFPAGDPRQRPIDPRTNKVPPSVNVPVVAGISAAQVGPAGAAAAAAVRGIPSDASDHEKAALIMQVLQLSDEQIAMLPPEQRNSILVLKEQIAKSTQR